MLLSRAIGCLVGFLSCLLSVGSTGPFLKERKSGKETGACIKDITISSLNING